METFDADELARWSTGRWTGPRPGTLCGVSIDTRTLQRGNVFIALKGDKADGHAYLPQAHLRGASAALVRRGTPPCGLPLLEVEDPRRALLDIATSYRRSLSARFVAVTGSTGKTTVKEMLADVLATHAPTARTTANWNNDIGLPLSLLAMNRTDAFGVFEVGMNHPGELDPLCALLKPACSVVTSVGPVHLEFFDSVESIAREKAAVLRALESDGTAVLQADDPWFPVLRSYVKSGLLTTSLRGDADYQAQSLPGGAFAVAERATGERAEFVAPLPGDYIVHDALLAIAVARHFGLAWDPIARAIRAYRPLPLRWQQEKIDDVLFINDTYNANPVSMRAALQAFAATPVSGKRWIVLGGMRELGAASRDEHVRLGRDAAAGSWAGILAVGADGHLIAEGAASAGARGVAPCATAVEAAAQLRERVRPGDGVLLKASRGEKLENVLVEWKKISAAPC